MSKARTKIPIDDKSSVPADSDQAELAEGASESVEDQEAVAGSVESEQSELQETQERLLRSQAELENYRKRAQRELEQTRRYAALPLMSDLLTVVDNIERAIESAEQNDGTEGLLEGIKMVAEQLSDVLKQHHCTRIPAVGEPFDPNVHEALGQQPSEEHPANIVMMETRTGYQLHDRVVRPSQVFVSSGPPPAETDQGKAGQQTKSSKQ